MTRIPASKVRSDFATIVNRVAFGGERVVVQRKGKGIVAVVPVEDLELLEAIEDRMDLDAARKALKNPNSKPYTQFRRELGLK